MSGQEPAAAPRNVPSTAPPTPTANAHSPITDFPTPPPTHDPTPPPPPPPVEVRDFCLRHGYADDNEVARAELATCTTALGEALQARLTDLAHQRIQESLAPTPDSIGAAHDAQGELRTSVVMRVPVEIGDARVGMLELFENETPADAARRFLERESLEPDPTFIETLETALKVSRSGGLNRGGGEVGPRSGGE